MRFQYPFPGKRKPVKLVSVFLLDPEFYLKFHNAPLSSIFKKIGEESLFKRLQKASKVLNPKPLLNELKNKFFRSEKSLLKDVVFSEDSLLAVSLC